MEAQFKKLINPPNASFFIKTGEISCLPVNQWHYHPEFELIVFREGQGTRIVGDNINTFQSGEIILVGPNLPHVIQLDKDHYAERKLEVPQMTVVQFDRDFLGKELWERTEFTVVDDLLNRTKRGIRFHGPIVDRVAIAIQRMENIQGIKKVMALLCLLEELACHEEYEYLSSCGFMENLEENDEKINKVYEYTKMHFREDISLEKIASLVYLSQSAFCRYFKSKTFKTYTEFLTEVRIGYACKLLFQEKLNISQICHACGYRNISNFNRYFKEVTQTTPSEYLRNFKNSILMNADYAA